VARRTRVTTGADSALCQSGAFVPIEPIPDFFGHDSSSSQQVRLQKIHDTQI
jgi:hypothetical protein